MRNLWTKDYEFWRDGQRPHTPREREGRLSRESAASAHAVQQPERVEAELHPRGLPEGLGTDTEGLSPEAQDAADLAEFYLDQMPYLLNAELALWFANVAQRFYGKETTE